MRVLSRMEATGLLPPSSSQPRQFGTARESTLAMLRELPDAEWDATPGGDKSIRARVTELLANDRTYG